MRPIAIIESPYAGDIERNTRYAQLAMRDSIMRGECPFASHLLYPQPNILNEFDPAERALGIELGYRLWPHASVIAFYCDLGISNGMKMAAERAGKEGLLIDMRRIDGYHPQQ
jgi:hypothetical protein